MTLVSVAAAVVAAQSFTVHPIETARMPFPKPPRSTWLLERVRDPYFRMGWRIPEMRKDAPSTDRGQR